MHPLTEASLRAALFDGGRFELKPTDTFANHPLPCDDPENLTRPVPTVPASPWVWHGPQAKVYARLWGGCLEVLDWILQSHRRIAEPTHYES